MKWVTIAIILLLLLISIVGCSSKSTIISPTQTPETTAIDRDWIPDGIINDGEYSDSSNYDDFSIFWRSDGETIYIGIMAKTDGWLAVSVQPGSRMKDADMIIGFVKDGGAQIQDQFSTGDFGPHSPDIELGGSDNIISFGGSEDDGFTTIEFSRKINTGDDYDTVLSTGINKIIWAYSSSDSLSARHSNRGYGEIKL